MEANPVNWLWSITETSDFPDLNNILKDSLYYPACFFDFRPIKEFYGEIQSFVYADYLVKKNEYIDIINGNGEPYELWDDDSGWLESFKPVCQKEIGLNELFPNEWKPNLSPTGNVHEVSLLNRWLDRCEPFAHWSVWDDAEGSATRFSLLYIASEMSTVYQGLYTRLNTVPQILTIINPGAIGGEWEDVKNPDCFFRKVISANTAGLPPKLLQATRFSTKSEADWPDYRQKQRNYFGQHPGLFDLA